MKTGDLSNEKEIETQFNKAWSTSDIELKSSVIK
jgi:hypothetical protein